MHNITRNRKNREQGFSLLELSIVLVLIGILITITLSLGTAQIEVGRMKSTQDKLDKIQVAMALYLKTNNFIPCPARPDGTGGSFGNSPDSGASVTCSATNILRDSGTTIWVGVVPVRTLNLPDDYMYDAWGNRITYVVSKYCVATANWSNAYPPANISSLSNKNACYSGTADSNGGNITIEDKADNVISSTAAYALISHGKNGGTIGAWNRTGSKTSSITNANFSKPERLNGNYNTSTGAANGTTAAFTTYYDAQFNDGTIVTNYYDDIVRWKTALQLDYDANH